MPDLTSVQASGLSELEATLNRLREFKRPTILRGMRRAVQPMIRLAQEKCPIGEGRKVRRGKSKTASSGDGQTSLKASRVKHLRDTIGATPSGDSNPYEVHLYVGTKYPTAHLVEYGHAIVTGRVVRVKAPGRRRRRIVSDTRKATGGRVRAYPFMRPAYDETVVETIATMQDAMRIEVDAAVAEQAAP